MTLVMARNYGQLGNRLMLYAHLIAASREWGVSLCNPCFAEYADFFDSTANDLWCRYPPREAAKAPSQRRRRLLARAVYLTAKTLLLTTSGLACLGRRPARWKVVQLRGKQTLDLGSLNFRDDARRYRYLLALGWLFRSERLFQKHADAIREHFRIREPHRLQVQAKLAEVRRSSDFVVGIHIRQGDYATFEGGRYYYNTKHYLAVMQSIADQLPTLRVAFLVCGNGQLTRGDFPGLTVHFGPGHMVEDMYSLAETDLLVGPPSTFTGWAAFYGKVPLAVLDSLETRVRVSDYFPQGRRLTA